MELKLVWQYLLEKMSSERLLIVQCLVFIILNVLDGLSTWLVMKPNHFERERNPIARWIFRKLKMPGGIILFKSLLLGLMGVYFSRWWNEKLTLNTGLLIGNLLFFYVVLHNFKVYGKFRQQDKSLPRIITYKVISE